MRFLEASTFPSRRLNFRAIARRSATAGRDRPGALHGPEVVLFDQPTSALDPEMIKEVLDMMVLLPRTASPWRSSPTR